MSLDQTEVTGPKNLWPEHLLFSKPCEIGLVLELQATLPGTSAQNTQ